MRPVLPWLSAAAGTRPRAALLALGLLGACTDAGERADSKGGTTASTATGDNGDGGGDTTGDPATTDADGDGSPAAEDCDDSDAAVHPGAEERCNGVDDDCDGTIDEAATDATDWFPDEDGDGHGNADADPTRACTAPADHSATADDCDDASGAVHPGAAEVCNDQDDDCDGMIDSDDPDWDGADGTVFYADADDDGHGDPEATALACRAPADHVEATGDCDDSDPAVHPGATEVCNGQDDDCDGRIDDDDDDVDLSTTRDYYVDDDGDGHGDPDRATESCALPAGHALAGDDCNDRNAAISPSATELCDRGNIDEDCDGLADNDDPSADPATMTAYAPDADGDRHGDASASPTLACDDPSTPSLAYTTDATDCDDADAAVNPAATEICDPLDTDEDCSGLADDDDPGLDTTTATTWYADADADGHGDAADSGTLACEDPSDASLAHSTTAGDCDDTDAAVNPDATEVCDSAATDEDCSGRADDDDPGLDTTTTTAWLPDADGDGHGDASAAPLAACADPSTGALAYTTDDTDCDDSDAAVSPSATEICDPLDTDEDCDGLADDADSSVDPTTQSDWFRDADGDGHGSTAALGLARCDDPSTTSLAYAAAATDCDDTDAAVNPDATEVCDSAATDEDCDGLADDADPSVDPTTQDRWWADSDGDGHGDPAQTTLACVDPTTSTAAWVDENTDCDDTDAAISPSATEVCDPLDTDEDCDGLADDADPSVDATTTTAWLPDADADGYGDATTAPTDRCDDPSTGALAYTTDDTDCDDSDAAVNPGATEICNGVDDDCDGDASDLGLVTGVSASGATSDHSASFGAGGSTSPNTITLSGLDTVQVCPGTYYVSLNVGSDVTVQGIGGAALVVLDGGGVDDVASLDDRAALAELTVQNGSATNGGCLTLRDDTRLDGVTVADCTATGLGGGALAVGTGTVIQDTTFARNTAASHGGALYGSAAGLTVVDSTFDDNEASHGGALYLTGATALDISGTTFTDNYADQDGGALVCDALATTTATLSTTTFDGNITGVGDGGAVFADSCSLDITDTTVQDGIASGDGGGLAVVDSDLTTDGLVLTGNRANGSGGGLAFDSAQFATLDGGSCTLNTATTGGGIWMRGLSTGGLRARSVDFSANSPSAAHSDDAGVAYTYGTAATFTCGPTGCI